VLLALAVPVAVANWWSRAHDDEGLEKLTKPTVPALLIAAAVLLDPASSTMRVWFVIALALCLVGDILLLPPDRFVAGLGAFLVGHVAFVCGFVAGGLPHLTWAGFALILLPVPLAMVGLRVIRGAARQSPKLARPVAAYLGVISLMLIVAIGHADAFGVVGAALFVVSDGILGWNRFVAPVPGAPLAVMATYHGALACLVLSLP